MQDHNLSYVTANLTNESLSSLRVNVLAFVGLDGRYVWSVGWDPKSHALLNIDILAGGELPPDHPWRSALHDGRKVSGLLRTNRGPLMAVFAPILNGFGQGPHRGMILLGRLVTDDEITRVGEQARVTLAAVSGEISGLRANLTRERLVEHEAATEVVRVFDDIEGSPVLTPAYRSPPCDHCTRTASCCVWVNLPHWRGRYCAYPHHRVAEPYCFTSSHPDDPPCKDDRQKRRSDLATGS